MPKVVANDKTTRYVNKKGDKVVVGVGVKGRVYWYVEGTGKEQR
jgi:hypothetical protein